MSCRRSVNSWYTVWQTVYSISDFYYKVSVSTRAVQTIVWTCNVAPTQNE